MCDDYEHRDEERAPESTENADHSPVLGNGEKVTVAHRRHRDKITPDGGKIVFKVFSTNYQIVLSLKDPKAVGQDENRKAHCDSECETWACL